MWSWAGKSSALMLSRLRGDLQQKFWRVVPLSDYLLYCDERRRIVYSTSFVLFLNKSRYEGVITQLHENCPKRGNSGRSMVPVFGVTSHVERARPNK
jgi:hypothetical protein